MDKLEFLRDWIIYQGQSDKKNNHMWGLALCAVELLQERDFESIDEFYPELIKYLIKKHEIIFDELEGE